MQMMHESPHTPLVVKKSSLVDCTIRSDVSRRLGDQPVPFATFKKPSMNNTSVAIYIRHTLCATALLAAPFAFAQQPSTAEKDPEDAFVLQMERETLVAAVTLHATCKERNPRNAAHIDANLKKEFAGMPARAMAYAKTAEFKTKLTARRKEQAEEAKTEAGAQLLQDMCLQMTALASK